MGRHVDIDSVFVTCQDPTHVIPRVRTQNIVHNIGNQHHESEEEEDEVMKEKNPTQQRHCKLILRFVYSNIEKTLKVPGLSYIILLETNYLLLLFKYEGNQTKLIVFYFILKNVSYLKFAYVPKFLFYLLNTKLGKH